MVSKVLIVDDVKVNRKLIKGILEKRLENVTFLEAESAFEAAEILAEGEVSVMILDVMMPEKDGLQFLEEVKQIPFLKHLPIIMCSALTEIESIEKALKLGALDYFTKPLTEEQMRITLPLKVKNALEYYEDKNALYKFHQKLKYELELAHQLQTSMVTEYKNFDIAEVRGHYIPCEKIGGDIFAVKEVGHKLWFMIADVTGYGISATMISTMISVMFDHYVEVCTNPDEVLSRINRTLYNLFKGSKYGLVSAFIGFLTNTKLCYSNAGHPYPILFNYIESSMEMLEAKGFLLGMFEERTYTSEVKFINEEDVLLLYTDGLFDKGLEKGYLQWGSVKSYCETKSTQLLLDKKGFVDSVIQHFRELEDKDFTDDVTVMLIHRKNKDQWR